MTAIDSLDAPTPSAEGESISVGTAKDNDVVLADATVSRYHLDVSRHDDGVLIVDHGSTNGTIVNDVRIERAVVAPGTILAIGRSRLQVNDGDSIMVDLHEGNALGGLRGTTPVMRKLMARIERAAQSTAAVLLIGESGTGKELAARAICELGPRAEQPFVTVDCGALTPTLVASELFGHERGAFTGATEARAGAFERADGGTILLDEVGELPSEMQAVLLGVLERRRFRRLGGNKEIAFDARLLSATHHDLRSEVNAGRFRLDLYYRLAVVTLRTPALREHSADIPLLVENFLRDFGYSGEVDAVVPPPTMEALCEQPWPGNVRELRNLVEATLAMGELLTPHREEETGVDTSDQDQTITRALGLPYRAARASVLAVFETRYLAELMRRADGNVSQAAREAQMDRSHLADLLRRHKLR